MVGKTLGHYEIIEPLGKGGMGEVYLGEDTRLGRKVAIKVLPAEFASDPERLARFDQEARAAAALNHPHIAVVHDVGVEKDDDGATIHFMVQEYLEGQSLRERLDRGALPLDKTLDLATEIGEALVAAHKAGIVHRDLKPDNIFVTEEGHAKVLDFGLAKLIEVTAPVGSELSMSPTMLGTVAGQVMGTAGYMAPEQINGEEVDQRADLFAFGCVLYGMVTGRQAFTGKNVHDTLGHILSDEPAPIADIDESLPPELQRIVRKLLAKDAARRYQTAVDSNIDLRQLKEDLASGVTSNQLPAPGPHVAESSKPLAQIAPWGLALLAVLVAAWALSVSGSSEAEPEPLFLPLGEFPTAASTFRLLDISPDGKQIVFSGGGKLQLLDLRNPGAVPEPIEGTERGNTPFFSSDSLWIGFFADGLLQRVRPGGALPEPIIETSFVNGASWEGDEILFASWMADWDFSIATVSATSGNGVTSRVTTPNPDADEQFFNAPSWLADGSYLLMCVYGTGWSVVVRAPESTEDLIRFAGHDPRFVKTGHIVYVQDQKVLARTFDPESLRAGNPLLGDPVVIVEGVVDDFANGFAGFALSDEGTFVYLEGTEEPTRELFVVTTDGNRTVVGDERAFYHVPALSPDGREIVLGLRDPREATSQLLLIDLETGIGRTLTAGRGNWNTSPVFKGGTGEIVYSRVGATGPIVLATYSATEDLPIPASAGYGPNVISLHPNGTIVMERLEGARTSIVTLSPDAAAVEPLVENQGINWRPRFSGSGNFVAYSSDVGGETQIWVTRYPSTGELPIQVSTAGGDWPQWSNVDEQLYFWSDNDLYVSDFDAENFTASPPELFLEEIDAGYDVAEDGSFVVTRNVQKLPKLMMIQNFFQYLEEKAPHRQP